MMKTKLSGSDARDIILGIIVVGIVIYGLSAFVSKAFDWYNAVQASRDAISTMQAVEESLTPTWTPMPTEPYQALPDYQHALATRNAAWATQDAIMGQP